jgi:flagellar export protein FliJ
MSTLDSLIRINRWKLDEQRRQIAELERLAGRLREEADRLVQELSSEQRVAGASFEASLGYPNFARELIERRRKLAASIAEVDSRIATARDALAETFGEVKRYEITAANRAKRERAAAGRKQAIALDEVALEIHRRRAAEG